MSGEINVLSRTQIIVVEPFSESVSIINAGPQGPAGPGGGETDLWILDTGELRPIDDPDYFSVITGIDITLSANGSMNLNSFDAAGRVHLDAVNNVEASPSNDFLVNAGNEINFQSLVNSIIFTSGNEINLTSDQDINVHSGTGLNFTADAGIGVFTPSVFTVEVAGNQQIYISPTEAFFEVTNTSGTDGFKFRSNGYFKIEPVIAGEGQVLIKTDSFAVLDAEICNFGGSGHEVMSFNVFSNGAAGITLEGQKIDLNSTGALTHITLTSFEDIRIRASRQVNITAKNSSAVDSQMQNESVVFYLDQATNKMKVRVKYSDGTLKTGEVALT